MIYRFGNCEVDTGLLEVRRAGRVHPIDPLEFDLLKYLIEHRDRVLTRDELLDTLWAGKVVTDSALSSRLKSVRAAVGDSGARQQVIKTIHGRGYRFIADLTKAPDAHDAPDAPAVAAPASPLTNRAFATTPAVGRDAELGQLTRWLDQAVAWQRSLVLISGEAGVGKTTLTRAFLDRARNRADAFVLHGQCVNQRGANEAYLPLLEALGRAGHQDPALTQSLRQHAPAWLAQLPSLVPAGEETRDEDAVGITTGRMLRELSDLLDQLARQRAVILVIEDLHWSDPSTIGWLEYYARRQDPARLLLIATLRPHGPFLAACRELAIRGHAHDLQLESIDETCVGDYLASRLDYPPTPELAALTYRRTGGFPLFIDTLLDHWLEHGLLRRSNATWTAADGDETLLAGVPATLSQLIDQQLANLDDEERRLLETAALAGPSFTAAAVAHALDDAQENIESHYARLARQNRIVRETGALHWPDGTLTATFEFRHELFREALCERVAVARRARLHRAFGERLQQAHGDNPGPVAGEIADHFARAHDVERALRYFYTAALSAFNRSAYRETIAMLDRALKLASKVPESAATQRIERDLQLLRASALISLEGWSSRGIETAYTRALELGDKLGLNDNSTEILGLAAMHENCGRYVESQVVIESLLERNTELAIEAHELLACSLFHQGRFDLSRSSAEQAIDRYDPREISAILARYGENPGVSCYNWAALDLWFLGYPDSALERSDQALERAGSHVYSLCSALTYRTFLHQFRNEPEQTFAWFEKGRDVAQQNGFDFRLAQISIPGSWARARLSDECAEQQAALDCLDEGLRRHVERGTLVDLPYQLTLKSYLLAHMGRPGDALAALEEAFASNPPGRAFFYEAEMLRMHAVLLLTLDPGAHERAAELLGQSLALARRQGARMLELRTGLTRCELADGGADTAAARDLRALMASLEEGRDTPDWQAACACIGARATPEKRGRRAAARAGPNRGPLSP